MARLCLVFIVVGAVLGYSGYQEWELSGVAQPQPQALTVAELIEQGPGENAHIQLGDFLLWDFEFVYVGEAEDKPWDSIWVPVVPLGGEAHRDLLAQVREDGSIAGEIPIPDDIRILLKSSSVKNLAQLEEFGARDVVSGMVINEIEKLPKTEARLLSESYPDIDFRRCWIFEEGRTPAGGQTIAGMLGGGLACAGLGVGGLLWARRREQEDEVAEPASAPSPDLTPNTGPPPIG